ncbi:MAG: tRNA (N6-isopentenyl adenosine(37)-C2)-methylthiotransferase MiaB, partial [Zetaproteobacteria bacterium]
ELGRYKHLKRRRPHLVIGVGGCVAQQEGERIVQRAPYVDLVFGPQSYHKLPEMIAKVRRERAPQVVLEAGEIEKFDHLPKPRAAEVTAYVTIMEGCDKFCTFCVVPFTRGPEVSRPAADVLAECRRMVEAGAKEVMLLGQNVNGWRGEGPDGEPWDFATLLYAVAEIPGLKRLRFTTSHPIEVTEGLAQAFAEIPNLMPYLHLPVQSGSDRILKAMHRGHTRAEYLEIIAMLREYRPDLAISTDFIVGFPGERDEDFADTLSLVEEVRFDSAYCFKYSPRPGTPAAELADDVPAKVKDERLQALLDLTARIAREKLSAKVGRVEEVLFEKPGKRPGDLEGRTPDFKIVHAKAPARLIGEIVPVRITEAYAQSLRGEVVVREHVA